MGLLLLCWLVFYPFGIVLPGLLVSYPLGGFLTGVTVCELVTEGVVGARVLGDDGIGWDLFPHSVGRAGGSFENWVLGGLQENSTQQKNTSTPCKIWELRESSVSFQGLEETSGFWGSLVFSL